MPPTPATPGIRNLRAAARKYHRAQEARNQALAELNAAIRAADREGGHTRIELIRVAQVGRQTVFDALKGKGR